MKDTFQRPGFVLYHDIISIVEQLTDEQAGRLTKAIVQYSKTGVHPELEPLLAVAFFPFKGCLDRDSKRYESMCERNKNNGLKGGRPKTQSNPENPVGYLGLENNPKKPTKTKQTQLNQNQSNTESLRSIFDRGNDMQEHEGAFNEIWSIYPEIRRGGYLPALRAYVAAMEAKLVTHDALKASLLAYIALEAPKQHEYTCLLVKFIEEQRYRNTYKPPPPPKSKYDEEMERMIKASKELEALELGN